MYDGEVVFKIMSRFDVVFEVMWCGAVRREMIGFRSLIFSVRDLDTLVRRKTRHVRHSGSFQLCRSQEKGLSANADKPFD
ncbi:hypothetical protein [Jeotgalibacillus haloalkalitolerans]|uniref:Uncharacterized protein n=1 Tax=Jeotgalibacillus haloalkalitolerans TaxID=3104292 RepID=A0ABU5KP96_9BACL|nr:hypothetical protein [Jeotgalibacillus sp. HH7-29]MDZ5712990.1 hypothetical protein [Jeotgalibacillus sp. HH7-29]